jgi:RNA polymerase sigma-70 factor (ECF subfamily)
MPASNDVWRGSTERKAPPPVEPILRAAEGDGDRTAFRALFERYKDRVYTTALHFCGDEASAKDITQIVFLKLYAKLDQVREEKHLATWLYRVVWTTCIDQKRRTRRWVPLDQPVGFEIMDSRESEEIAFARRRVAEAVSQAIGELRPKLRMAILLKYIEGLSYEEIAAVLGCSKGTVASRLNRGHKVLAKRLAHLRGEVP